MNWIDVTPFWAAANSILIVAAVTVFSLLAVYWLQSLQNRMQRLEKLIAYLHGRLEKIEKDFNKELVYADRADTASEKTIMRETPPPAPAPAPTPAPDPLSEFMRQKGVNKK